jgi:hypothetical protein
MPRESPQIDGFLLGEHAIDFVNDLAVEKVAAHNAPHADKQGGRTKHQSNGHWFALLNILNGRGGGIRT